MAPRPTSRRSSYLPTVVTAEFVRAAARTVISTGAVAGVVTWGLDRSLSGIIWVAVGDDSSGDRCGTNVGSAEGAFQWKTSKPSTFWSIGRKFSLSVARS